MMRFMAESWFNSLLVMDWYQVVGCSLIVKRPVLEGTKLFQRSLIEILNDVGGSMILLVRPK
jgi:hypothetical protein